MGGYIPTYDFETELTLDFIGDYLTNPFTGPLHHWLRNEKGWTYGLNGSVEVQHDQIKWILEFPLNDAEAIQEIRRELPGRIHTALTDTEAITLEKQRQINGGVFNWQTAKSRINSAADCLQDMGRIPPEAEFKQLLETMDRPGKLSSLFDQYLHDDARGEFLALPQEATSN